MGKIHQLPENIISKIAAGEVIERPAFAVKELVDNSLDAGATSITIHIEQSGLKKIQVIDDGEGMSREDLLECFKPHTTSKIAEEDDLSHIRTFGFRGEALSSIAAIGVMEITSRTKDDMAGTTIKVQNSVVVDIVPSAAAIGTTMTISHLFSSVPARKQFLKSQKTEFKHIVDIVINFAIMYPKIKFLLTHNGKVVLDLPSNQDMLQRLKSVIGGEVFENLIPLEFDDAYLRLSGFIAKPQIMTHRGGKQFLFVNKRQVSDKLISLAIKEGFGNLLEPIAQPVFILFLEVPVETVDVNVHPRKEQVSFYQQQAIYSNIQRVVQETLQKYNLTFHTNGDDIFFPNKKIGPRFGNIDSTAGQLLKESVLPWNVKDETVIIKNDEIQQLHNLYLLVQTKKGFMLIDQHAAHERILYEQFLQEFKEKKVSLEVYLLEALIPLNLFASDKEQFTVFQSDLKKLGFDFEEMDDNFVVRTVPYIFKDRDIAQLIKELLEDLSSGIYAKEIDTHSNKMVAYLACRAAVKAGDRLTKDEAKRLLDQLEKTPNNFTCPHGRPTKIEVSLNRLHRIFKRQ